MSDLILPKLSYKIMGVLFKVHTELVAIIANFKRKSLEYFRLINPLVVDDYKRENYNSVNDSVKLGQIRNKFGQITQGKILAIDYGTKYMGLAISDDEQRVALPFQTISVKTSLLEEKSKVLEDLSRLVELEKIGRVIIGLPLNSSGGRTKLGDEVFVFAKELEDNVDVPVEVMDERMTSKLAASLPYKTARNIHELSAQILLQDYLDKQASNQ